MNLQISLDAREVLFHLNYMGYTHITREQLKSFMIDLKKLIKYESNTQQPVTNDSPNHAQEQLSYNIERLFECHTTTSKLKQRKKHYPTSSKDSNIENCKENHNRKLTRNRSSHDIIMQNKEHAKQKSNDAHSNQVNKNQVPKEKAPTENKENIPNTGSKENKQQEEVKSKMWIRPKSSQTRPQISMKKRNDPVALYQEYQKDWERFRTNICESSRSELRWKIREKMLSHN